MGYLFVYGTFRKKESNHSFLKDAVLIASQAWLKGTLYDTAKGYPALDLNGDSAVYGELYEIDQDILSDLDEVEGFKEGRESNLFVRRTGIIHTDLGEKEASYYTAGNRDFLIEEIKSGDWRVHKFIQNPPEELYYFAYGSCMDNERFKKAKVDHLFTDIVGGGRLKNFSMKYTFCVHDGGRGDIVEDFGETEGVLYRVNWDAFDYLFEREGVAPGWYRAALVDIETSYRTYDDVLTFIVIAKHQESRPPLHYAREILRGANPHVSKDYMNKLYNQLVELKLEEKQLLELKTILQQ
ncbi:gamma-glutamylcyclotransferase [Falsibacillus albus]|uniref:Gamma-glutamylcyclotransferase n=1 Tax=Falsibacillus albus TaxID=2478915 RepID=A0A3L7JYR4_9BACI|nr:gamma-glutamylcyclotransferase [Falsibacillus albus]RLQ95404.1 gamma-glutamylcyclotransferase [Falsibacillus albus]